MFIFPPTKKTYILAGDFNFGTRYLANFGWENQKTTRLWTERRSEALQFNRHEEAEIIGLMVLCTDIKYQISGFYTSS